MAAVFLYCAWKQARTADPSLFRGVLYQLSYPSILRFTLYHATECSTTRTERGEEDRREA